MIIWDEGIVHAAHNLFVHTNTRPNEEEIVKFGRMVPKPDILVWVTAPTDQSRAVVLARGHQRVPPTANAAQVFVEHAQTTFNVLCGVRGLRERIYRVDNAALAADSNDALIQARARAVGDFLLQRLRDNRPKLPQPTISETKVTATVAPAGQPVLPTPASVPSFFAESPVSSAYFETSAR